MTPCSSNCLMSYCLPLVLSVMSMREDPSGAVMVVSSKSCSDVLSTDDVTLVLLAVISANSLSVIPFVQYWSYTDWSITPCSSSCLMSYCLPVVLSVKTTREDPSGAVIVLSSNSCSDVLVIDDEVDVPWVLWVMVSANWVSVTLFVQYWS